MARAKKESPGLPSVGDLFEPAPLSGQVLAHQDLSLLEVSEATDLQSLMLDGRIKPLILAAISSTQALVLPQNTKALLEALRKAGHTPKVQAGTSHV